MIPSVPEPFLFIISSRIRIRRDRETTFLLYRGSIYQFAEDETRSGQLGVLYSCVATVWMGVPLHPSVQSRVYTTIRFSNGFPLSAAYPTGIPLISRALTGRALGKYWLYPGILARWTVSSH
ncbi:hypothetical protein ARMSODRAFT_226826 [Armillaria solidipes]|uniref:Uncharacterized protein n=1 Tax=Armillaria solidipes TaxID=1076256 RepID=A0A2H3CMD1_9AGAR|nr:hypothetical protein ARMSODRAFT_226826 [Armillaria solidipes]